MSRSRSKSRKYESKKNLYEVIYIEFSEEDDDYEEEYKKGKGLFLHYIVKARNETEAKRSIIRTYVLERMDIDEEYYPLWLGMFNPSATEDEKENIVDYAVATAMQYNKFHKKGMWKTGPYTFGIKRIFIRKIEAGYDLYQLHDSD